MLKEISFFAGISDSDRLQIAELMVERKYRKGAVIVEELTEAERFFVIYRGKIEISKRFDGNEELVLAVQSDGDFFGEMALLDERPRSATARAIEPTTVLEIPRGNFESLLSKAPQLALRIMKELSTRLRETSALLISHLQQRNRLLYHAHIDTLTMVVQAVEKRNAQTQGRTRRITSIAKEIGKEMGLADEELQVLELSALLHDLGMLALPEALLGKPGPLEENELRRIKSHTEKAQEMLEGIPLLEKAIPQIIHHHEQFDGSGYPRGLSGTNIPLASRIIAVVDAFEAMTRDRAWRERREAKQAMEEISKASGIQFDPDVVVAFLKLWEAGRITGQSA
jgi:HD-GYP domain-containing protein (c-di-GMP phosphodiesterase class II)